jgi:quinol monooxygenase YgiN
MLTFRLHMTFAPQTGGEAAATLRSLVGPVRSEPGCSATRVHRGAGQSYELTWVSEWRGTEDFERHLRAPAFRQILAVIELASGPPKVEIDDVNSRRGFELIEEILGRSPADRAGLETG